MEDFFVSGIIVLPAQHPRLNKLIPAPESTTNRNPSRSGNCSRIVGNLPEVTLLILIVLECDVLTILALIGKVSQSIAFETFRLCPLA